MILVGMLIGVVRGKVKAIGVAFVRPFGVNTEDSTEEQHAKNYVSSSDSIWQ